MILVSAKMINIKLSRIKCQSSLAMILEFRAVGRKTFNFHHFLFQFIIFFECFKASIISVKVNKIFCFNKECYPLLESKGLQAYFQVTFHLLSSVQFDSQQYQLDSQQYQFDSQQYQLNFCMNVFLILIFLQERW